MVFSARSSCWRFTRSPSQDKEWLVQFIHALLELIKRYGPKVLLSALRMIAVEGSLTDTERAVAQACRSIALAALEFAEEFSARLRATHPQTQP